MFMLAMDITWTCLITGSQFMPDRFSDLVFFLGIFFESFAKSLPFYYLVNMYIVDVCVPANRWVLDSGPQ